MYLGMLLSSYGPFWQTFVVDFKAIALSVQAIDLADCQKVIAHTQSGENGPSKWGLDQAALMMFRVYLALTIQE